MVPLELALDYPPGPEPKPHLGKLPEALLDSERELEELSCADGGRLRRPIQRGARRRVEQPQLELDLHRLLEHGERAKGVDLPDGIPSLGELDLVQVLGEDGPEELHVAAYCLEQLLRRVEGEPDHEPREGYH